MWTDRNSAGAALVFFKLYFYNGRCSGSFALVRNKIFIIINKIIIIINEKSQQRCNFYRRTLRAGQHNDTLCFCFSTNHIKVQWLWQPERGIRGPSHFLFIHSVFSSTHLIVCGWMVAHPHSVVPKTMNLEFRRNARICGCVASTGEDELETKRAAALLRHVYLWAHDKFICSEWMHGGTSARCFYWAHNPEMFPV